MKGFIVSTPAGWRFLVKYEIDIENELIVDELDPDEERALLEAFTVDSDDEEDESDFGGLAVPAVDEFLARTKRKEDVARLARRLEERLASDTVLGLLGISPEARDRMIDTLESRLSGKAEELSVQRAELRSEAEELAPQNLTRMIGEPKEGRKA